jgi:hypothetical protein
LADVAAADVAAADIAAVDEVVVGVVEDYLAMVPAEK